MVIPAIDVKDGRCVRLRQGRMSDETVFSEYPEEMAKRWYSLGAERIHVVDLNGAHQGVPVNRKVIARMVRSVPVPIQLGGGIRDMETADAYLSQGVRWVIIGTGALKDPDFVMEAASKYPGRIILGIDARNGRVAVEGWTEDVGISPCDLALRFESVGISAIVYTDVQRDGMKVGPNVEATREMASCTKIPVIASGGISDITDVRKILGLAKYGVIGMISGRALYDGTLRLDEAISLCKSGERVKK